MLRGVFLIAKREYLERVRSKVFRITTVLVPLGMGALVAIGGVGGKRLEGVRRLAIVSDNPVVAQGVKTFLATGEAAPQYVEVVAPAREADRTRLKQEVAAHRIDGYLSIELGARQADPDVTWVSANAVNFLSKSELESAVHSAVVREQLLARGMPPGAVETLMNNIDLKTMQLRNGLITASDNERSFMGAYALILLLYGSVLIYGVNIARSVVEEKTSRVFEVLLSTVSADTLMLGKLLGVGAAGLTQIGIWLGLLVLYAGSAMAASEGIHGLGSLGITGTELVYFAVFFLLGYFFYSGLAAAFGSTVSGEQEVQQFSLLIVSPLVASIVMLPFVLGNPSSPASVALSLIPPFTPIILYMRICSQMPPVWQVALGITLLGASVWGMVWLAARIYRIGVLMYGKRATLPEMLRWLRYS
jgi:ABC-2 type transport system permease protein